MKETKLTHFVTLSDGSVLDVPKLGGNKMGKNKELQSNKTWSRHIKYTKYTKEESIYITNCILMFLFHLSIIFSVIYILHSFLSHVNE